MFLSVTRNWVTPSRICDSSNARGFHTWLDDTRNSRTASAPYLGMTDHGSTMLPRRLDIFTPSASRTRSFTTTDLYGAVPGTGNGEPGTGAARRVLVACL